MPRRTSATRRLAHATLAAILSCAAAAAQDPGLEFFEKRIRPVLAERCYACHSSKLKTPMGGLAADSPAALLAGGQSGPALEPGDPASSLLLRALRFDDPHLQMPPTGKLPDAVIADFERWIAMGAPAPAEAVAPPPARAEGPDYDKGRQWWAFQPVREHPVPAVRDGAWARTRIDRFLLARLEDNGLEPSPEASRRALIRRLYFDLIGLPPTYEEVEAFAADPAPGAYEQLVERLLASPHYGERWGRYWLDVARWAEDHPTSEATNQPHPYAWRYRDWVIEALNDDLPYDRFLKLQLAADLLPDRQPADIRALGYIGNSPVYHKDVRLSKDVIETFASDEWDERVDAVTRGLLGLTVACARCHDHKFDPVSADDYHALAGVFASSALVKRPVTPMEPEREARLVWAHDRIVQLTGSIRLLSGAEGKTDELDRKVKAMQAELEALQKEVAAIDVPLTHAVADAGIWIDGSDPTLTFLDIRFGQPRDLPVFLGGNVARPGKVVPRRFLTVLSKGAPEPFRQGSGRLELAEKITGDARSLAGRILVNRVWAWHFGRPLVTTASDFGTQGEPRRILNSSTISPRASSPTAGRSNGCTARSCSRPPGASRAPRTPPTCRRIPSTAGSGA